MPHPTLYYLSNNKIWNAIPYWANFFIFLGSEFIKKKAKGKRLILILTVPCRNFVAPFLGIGVITELVRQLELNEHLLVDHFERLMTLENGTPLIYHKGNRILKAIFTGVEYVAGEKRIKVQITGDKGGNLTELLNIKNSLMVRVGEQDEIKLPANQIGKASKVFSPFSEEWFHDIKFKSVLFHSEIKILFIGNKKDYQNECQQTLFAVKSGKTYKKGTLNDLLRIKSFLGERDVYRSEVISHSKDKVNHKTQHKLRDSSIVIFDGSSGFLSFRENLTEFSWILVLDRTDSNVDDALSMLYNRYMEDRRRDIVFDLDTFPVPPGVELLVWEESS